MIYLDNAASTAVHPEVVKEMLPYFDIQYGNPSSIHQFGRKAKNAIQKARKQVAALIGAEPDEILFTSGGTESNNTILYGIPKLHEITHVDFDIGNNHAITSSVEHEAILEPCKKLEEMGFKVTYISVDEYGVVDSNSIADSITENTVLVSIMFANNEVGTIQPIKEISEICKKYQVPLHTDAVQAVGKIPINVKDLGIDALSISSHKINGPKGVGALFIKKDLTVYPEILGGGQENGMRSGTENVHLTFFGVNGEDLIIKLDEHGIAASTGSACSVHTQKASHVLKAMGFNQEQITGSLRISFGYMNTSDEVDQAVGVLKKVVAELRSVSPYKTKYNF